MERGDQIVTGRKGRGVKRLDWILQKALVVPEHYLSGGLLLRNLGSNPQAGSSRKEHQN